MKKENVWNKRTYTGFPLTQNINLDLVHVGVEERIEKAKKDCAERRKKKEQKK